MYQPVIAFMQSKGVIFQKGLSLDEVKRIEDTYNFSFPVSLRLFLMTALPITAGFYRWRDFSLENVDYIKNLITFPFENAHEYAADIDWYSGWGDEPTSKEEHIAKIREYLKEAPKLIPVFSHRYVPVISNNEDPPVISFHSASDLVYYGGNLSEYFQVEFGQKKYDSIDFLHIRHVPFWSEIM